MYCIVLYIAVEKVWTAGVPLEMTGIALSFIGMVALLCYPCHRKLNFSKITCAAVIAIIITLGSEYTYFNLFEPHHEKICLREFATR